MTDHSRLVVVSENYAHHGKYSSYHHILDYIPDFDIRITRQRKISPLHGRIERRRMALIRRFDELRAGRSARSESARGLLYLYPEHGCRSAGLKSRAPIVTLVCHLPEETLEQVRHNACRGFTRALPHRGSSNSDVPRPRGLLPHPRSKCCRRMDTTWSRFRLLQSASVRRAAFIGSHRDRVSWQHAQRRRLVGGGHTCESPRRSRQRTFHGCLGRALANALRDRGSLRGTTFDC